MLRLIWLFGLLGMTGFAMRTATSASGLSPMISERPSIRQGSNTGARVGYYYFRSAGRSHRGGSFSYGK